MVGVRRTDQEEKEKGREMKIKRLSQYDKPTSQGDRQQSKGQEGIFFVIFIPVQ